MSTPDSLIDLLAMQPPEARLNTLLESYLIHHPDSAIYLTWCKDWFHLCCYYLGCTNISTYD